MSWAIWVTGLPGSGKSVLARGAVAVLRQRGISAVHLELDVVRRTLTPRPTYSDSERDVVYRALVYMALALTEAGVPVIIDATAHRRAWRVLARRAIARFAEVQLECPLEVCQNREAQRTTGHAPRGIYARAGGPGARVPGVDVPYERSVDPDLVLRTEQQSVSASVHAIVDLARQLQGNGEPVARLPEGGWAIWITGLPGSGKTTLACAVARALAGREVPIRILDLFTLRAFTLQDRPESETLAEIVYRAVAYTAKLLTDAGVAVIVDATAPRRAWRDMARQLIARFAEVQLLCPREICLERERSVRWRLGGQQPPMATRPPAAWPELVLDYELSLQPELTLHTHLQDLTSAADEIVRLVHRFRRAALVREYRARTGGEEDA